MHDLFGFAGTASCDAAFAVARPSGALFFAPFAASDALHDPALASVFHVRPALADEAYKVTRHCATLNQDRIAVFAEDDAMGRAGLAAVNQALIDLKRPPILASALSPVNSDKVDGAVAQLMKAQPQAIIQVSLFNSAAAFIRKMRRAGFGGQFLTFSVVGIDPLFSALGKKIGGIVISQVVPSPRSTATPIIKETWMCSIRPTRRRVTRAWNAISPCAASSKVCGAVHQAAASLIGPACKKPLNP